MATHRIPILGPSLTVDGGGNIVIEPYDVRATNDVWKHKVISFKDSAVRNLVYGVFSVPKNYVGTAKVIIVWNSATITGNVVWDFDYRAVGGDNAESLDQAGTQEAVTVTDAAPGTAHFRLEVSITLTAANFAVDDTVEFLFGRDSTDAADTMAGIAHVHGLYFEYNDA